jgi:tRNA threonylcarbamoyladenosine biosynthesis protein TsaB
MALILNIDTATETAVICLSKDGQPLQLSENKEQKDHAGWVHTAIKEMMLVSGYSLKQLNAVAVTNGPGSYTGIRVGLSTAKGLCFALSIPLITENTLKVMAAAARKTRHETTALLCPMIDARRMEVYTGLYNNELLELRAPEALILDSGCFSDLLEKEKVLFFGNGSEKWRKLVNSSHAMFLEAPIDRGYLYDLSFTKYQNRQFTDIVYSEPVYTKEFYTHTKK